MYHFFPISPLVIYFNLCLLVQIFQVGKLLVKMLSQQMLILSFNKNSSKERCMKDTHFLTLHSICLKSGGLMLIQEEMGKISSLLKPSSFQLFFTCIVAKKKSRLRINDLYQLSSSRPFLEVSNYFFPFHLILSLTSPHHTDFEGRTRILVQGAGIDILV